MSRLVGLTSTSATGANRKRRFDEPSSSTPDYAAGLVWYGFLLNTLGRHDEAVVAAERALSLESAVTLSHMYLGAHFVWAGRPHEAIERLRIDIELDPSYVQGHRYLGQAYEKAGEIDNAVAAYEKAIELSDGALGLGDLGHLYAVSGQETKAREILRQLQDPSAHRYLAPVEMVRLYAGLGEQVKLHE